MNRTQYTISKKEVVYKRQSSMSPEHPHVLLLDIPRMQGPELLLPGPFLRVGSVASDLKDKVLSPWDKEQACLPLTVKVVSLQMPCSSPVMQPTAGVGKYPDPPVSTLWDWEDLRNWHKHKALAAIFAVIKSFVSDPGISCCLPAPWNSNELAC